jgi:hypothetical protein
VLETLRRAVTTAVAGALLLLASARGYAQCLTGSSIVQWHCWEQTLVSSVDFYNKGAGNPYRDVILRVTFTSGATSFTQDAFWGADTGSSSQSFKVRAALPAGNWSWQVATCTINGQNCGATWTPSSGTITVSSLSSISKPQLYARGFPKQNCLWDKAFPPNLVSCGPLVYGDSVTPFFWLGDTVWSAPAVEIDAQTHGKPQYWSSYLAARTPDGPGPASGNYHFTAILVSPADSYQTSNDAEVFSTQPSSSCTIPPAELGSYPNHCSLPVEDYWNRFDGLIAQAAPQDLLILIAGLMHPFDTNPYSTYPSLTNVVHLSRYIAARMAGFPVAFSPGFDLAIGGTAVDGNTLQTIMDASGKAVQAASPRALIANHLNGQALCTDYEAFSQERPSPSPWMTWYLFQSGHAASNQTSGPTASCPGYITGETKVQTAMRRAIVMPSTLATAIVNPSNGQTLPSLPAINGEGPYDIPSNDVPPNYSQVDLQYHVRQAANLSSLSDAQGFTYGVKQLGTWTSPPSSYWALSSAIDMQRLADRFMSYPGLQTYPAWLANNQIPSEQQRVIASDDKMIAIAYLPSSNPTSKPPSESITLNTNALVSAGLSSLGCPGTGSWTLTWETPTTNFTQPVGASNCSQAAGQITLTSPLCGSANSSQECDWILLMSKTQAPAVVAQPASSALMPSSARLDVWRDLSTGDGTAAILAQIGGANALSAPIVVSPSGLAFQDGSRVAAVPGGFVVVWHADGLDGSQLGVFGQRLDVNGRLVGPMFRVNSMTTNDQRDPAISADQAGNTIVVWSSYGQDGDLGGIYGQIFDPAGRAVGGEFQVNRVTQGHQARPQVLYLPSGSFIVGWTTEAIESDPGALSFLLFDRNGIPLTNEIRVPGSDTLHPELIDIQHDAGGGFSLRWLLRDNTRATVATYLQQFLAQGSALGSPMEQP